jgi:hypothetical protein
MLERPANGAGWLPKSHSMEDLARRLRELLDR